MRAFTTFALVTVMLATLGTSTVRAEEHSDVAPWSKSCRAFSSGTKFVKESAKFCLKHEDVKGCTSKARHQFDKCRFEGNFEKMSARARARMILVIALSSLRPVRNLDL